MHSEKLSSKPVILLQIMPTTIFISISSDPYLSNLASLEQGSLEVNFVWLFEDLLYASNIWKGCFGIFSYPLVIDAVLLPFE